MSKTVYAATGFVSILLSLFLTYKVLEHIGATELMWFVWMINIPFGLITHYIRDKYLKEDKS